MLEDITRADSFTSFAKEFEPKLRHSLIPLVGADAATDATAEALAYGWEHWDRLRVMDNPAGYLYRVARTKARKVTRRRPLFLPESAYHLPHVEPGLPNALAALSDKQRTVVWLVHGLDWQRREVAELLGVSEDTVRTHLSRGMGKLQRALGGGQ